MRGCGRQRWPRPGARMGDESEGVPPTREADTAGTAREAEVEKLRQMLQLTVAAAKEEKLRADEEEARAKQLAAEVEAARKQAEHGQELATAHAHEVETKEVELQRLRADLGSVEVRLKEEAEEAARKQAEHDRTLAASHAQEVETKEAELQRLRADLSSVEVRLKEAQEQPQGGGCCVIT